MPASPLRLLLTLALGFAAAWLVACGGSSKGLLAGTSAENLKSQLDTISGEVQDGQCAQAKASAHALGAKVSALPPSVDPKLRRTLSDGAKQLLTLAAGECRAPRSTISTETAPPTDTLPSTPSTTSTSTPTTDSTPTTTSTPSTPTTPKPQPTIPVPTAPSNGGAGSGGGLSGGGGAAGPGKGK